MPSLSLQACTIHAGPLGLTWLPKVLTLFSFQMSMLVTSLRNDDSKPLQNNYRLAQDLHGRQVLASFQTTLFSAKQLPSGKEHMNTLRLHLAAGTQRWGEE